MPACGRRQTKSRDGFAEQGDVGIEGVNNRIADIQSRIIALQTQAAGTVTKSPSTSGTTSASGTAFARADQGASVVSALPVVILYMVFQRYLIGGLTAGGVKG